MKLYYFTGPNHAVENVEKQRLKISFSDTVNDVFEMMPYDFGTNVEIRRRWRKSITNHAKNTGFLCFSETWRSPSMWGLYADKHQGVCYGFEAPDNLTKINYEKHFRSFDVRALDDPGMLEEAFTYAQRTKSCHWHYENEWRMFIGLNEARKSKKENKFAKFSDCNLEICEIIIGQKSNLKSSQFRNVLAEPEKVKIQTARASFRDYKMVPQERESMQK